MGGKDNHCSTFSPYARWEGDGEPCIVAAHEHALAIVCASRCFSIFDTCNHIALGKIGHIGTLRSSRLPESL